MSLRGDVKKYIYFILFIKSIIVYLVWSIYNIFVFRLNDKFQNKVIYETLASSFLMFVFFFIWFELFNNLEQNQFMISSSPNPWLIYKALFNKTTLLEKKWQITINYIKKWINEWSILKRHPRKLIWWINSVSKKQLIHL